MPETNQYAGEKVDAPNFDKVFQTPRPANPDLQIHVVSPIDFPYHKWLAFSAQVQSDVVKRMREHGLIES